MEKESLDLIIKEVENQQERELVRFETNLSEGLNKYKEIIYEKVEYEEPEVILQKLEELSKSIDENLKELKVMLDEDI